MEKVKKAVGLSVVSLVIILVMTLLLGGILKLLGVYTPSSVLFFSFIFSYFLVASVVDVFLEPLMKVVTRALSFSSPQGFSLYLLIDFVVSYKVFQGLNLLFPKVIVPTSSALIFLGLLSLITWLTERPLTNWLDEGTSDLDD